jgi:hypothetical protein
MLEEDLFRGIVTPNSQRNYRKINHRQLESSFAMEGAFMLQTLPKRMASRGLRAAIQKESGGGPVVITAEGSETITRIERILNGHDYPDFDSQENDAGTVPPEEYFDYVPNPLCPDDPILGSFFNGLVDNLHTTQENVDEKLAPFYLDKRPFLDRISPIISELNQRVVAYEQATEQVKTARSFLHVVANVLAPKLGSLETGMIYYGSAIYNDPHNLDLDIEFFAKESTKNEAIVDRVAGFMDKEWGEVLGRYTGVNVSLQTLNELERVQAAVENQDYAWIYTNAYDLDENTLGSFSICFTGSLLFAPYPNFFSEMQQAIVSIAEKNPIVAGSIHKSLHDALQIRKKRSCEE